jgi:transposase
MVREAKVSSVPDANIRELRSASGDFMRVGLEDGPLSQWLCLGLKDAGLPVVCVEARRAKAAMGPMNRNKNDRNDV